MRKVYRYNGSSKELKDELKRLFYQKNDLSFKASYEHGGIIDLLAKVSYGTIQFNNSSGPGISVKLTHREINQETQEVHFYTSIRIEQYFLLITSIVIQLVSISSGESIWTTTALGFGILLICHGFFHWVYRAQEESIVEELVKNLKLSQP